MVFQRNIHSDGNGCKKHTFLLFQNWTIVSSCETKGVKHSLVSEILGQSNIYLPDLEKFWDTEVPEVAGSYLEKAESGGWME